MLTKITHLNVIAAKYWRNSVQHLNRTVPTIYRLLASPVLIFRWQFKKCHTRLW